MLTSRNAVPSVGVAADVAPRVQWLLAPNAGAWTFQGTNTWIVGDRSSAYCAVIDPGPDDEVHLASLVEAIGERQVSQIVLTHGHNDHAGSAGELARSSGAPVLAASEMAGRTRLGDGDRVMLANEVVAYIVLTPGHTRDSLCVFLPEDRLVFTGDTLLGSGSPVVHPALLRKMLDSLRTLEHLGSEERIRALPGHGAAIADLSAASARRITARGKRIRQVASLQAEGEMTVDAMVARMYPEIDHPDVVRAAQSSVQAMLTFLEEELSDSAVAPRECST